MVEAAQVHRTATVEHPSAYAVFIAVGMLGIMVVATTAMPVLVMVVMFTAMGTCLVILVMMMMF